MNNHQAITTQLERMPEESVFSVLNFEHAQRVAKMLASSSLVPKDFQNSVQNVLIALEVANRIGASPLMVMQNLYVVHGKPSWSSAFIIAALNNCKQFSPLRFELTGQGDSMECYAWAYELSTNEKIIGPTVSIAMAKAEGWYTKSGSKWPTMPTVMLRYRAASFFGRLYAPQILMGMHSQEEIQDIQPEVVSSTVAAPAAPATPVTEPAQATGSAPVSVEPATEQDLAFEVLQSLYDEKIGFLTKSEMDHAKRILKNKEVDSYQKLHTFLTSKTA